MVAATAGLPFGNYHVGKCYKQGSGVARNLQEAARFLRAAGQTSDAASMLAQVEAEAQRASAPRPASTAFSSFRVGQTVTVKSASDMKAILDHPNSEWSTGLGPRLNNNRAPREVMVGRNGVVAECDMSDSTVKVTFGGATPTWFTPEMLIIQNVATFTDLKYFSLRHVATGKYAKKHPTTANRWVAGDEKGVFKAHYDSGNLAIVHIGNGD